ncbi:hypothetical protein CPB84DRAFT_1966255 [Gymnopilus junonius]|uniref:Uncharacterized protein n=1 Tax=Gymnopilus junonius TaxID=109634 RepID=A0A9P5NBZ8_GYMJU|nr:hypothetical protein CPB84DRAFT_1966255 [Gymnopilus junonius]
MPTLALTAFPEELLEGILSYCVVAPLIPQTRPLWHRPSSVGASSTPPPDIMPPILSHRSPLICKPTAPPARLGLRPNPAYATYIRRAVGYHAGYDAALASVAWTSSGFGSEEFCEGLKDLVGLTHLVVRKPSHVYLTQPRPRIVLSEVAKAMDSWDELEFADLAFRLTDDSGMLGPITAITHSLRTRPKLHTFSTMLPSVWNETILHVSENPALERVILGDGHSTSGAGGHGLGYSGRGGTWSGTDFYAAPVSASLPAGPLFESVNHGQGSILGTGLFLTQARKHLRLSELIRAGTSIIRTRAQTLGTPPSPSSLPVLPVLPYPHPHARAQTPASQLQTGTPSSSASDTRAHVSLNEPHHSRAKNVVPMP